MSRTCIAAMVVVLLLAFLVAPVVADVIYLKDGRKFTGKVVSESGGVVKFKSVGGVLTFKKSEVDHIKKGLTKKDEYNARRKKIAKDDIAGLLALARWCEEEGLVAQKRKIYRELTKMVPNHPQIRRAMGQIHQDGKWVKRPKDYTEPTVTAGKRKEMKGMSFVLPKSWKITAEEDTGLVATGPAPYAQAPFISLRMGIDLKDLLVQYPEKQGWSKAEEVTYAGLKGYRSRRSQVKDEIESVELSVLVRGPDHSLLVTVVTLALEEKRNAPALSMLLESIKIKAPPSDYTNEHYKYCLNLPKGEGWVSEEDKDKDLYLGHRGHETEDWAMLWVIAGAAGEEAQDVMTEANKQVAALKRSGDITKRDKIKIGGEEAEYVDGTFLEDGIPLRMRILWMTHGKKTFLIYFQQHEFGVKRTNDCWDILIKSFRFLD